MAMRVNFTGVVNINPVDAEKNPGIRKGVTGNKKKYKTLNLSIASAKNNKAFMELFGMDDDTISTYDTDGNQIEVSVDDRFDEDIVNKVAGYMKNIIVMPDGSRHEFIRPIDFVSYIEENYDEINGKTFQITGSVNKNTYQGKVSDKFQISSMYYQDEDVKKKLTVTIPLTFTAEDFDFSQFKEDKKIYLTGKTLTYVNKKDLGTDKGANRYMTQQVIMDASKLDFDNEKHMALLDYKLKQIGVKRDGMKLSTVLKKNKVYTLTMHCAYTNGQQEVEFDESSLTPNQKMAIDLGLNKLSDFMPKGSSMYGPRITEYRITNYDLRDESANGCYDTEMSMSDYEELWFTPLENESLDDFEKKAESTSKAIEDDDSDLDDLFG